MATSNGRLSQFHTWNEIVSQSEIWQGVLRYLSRNSSLETILSKTAERTDWIFVGCGTSLYLAEAAAHSWASLTGTQARALPASEVILFSQLIKDRERRTQAVVISRSGQTSEAVRSARILSQELRVPTLGITCADNSALEQACDFSIVLPDLDEKSTVMTRSFTSMLLSLQVLAACRVGNSSFLQELRRMTEQFAPRVQIYADIIEGFVTKHSFEDYVFLGQGGFYGIAREAALKVMEMSCSYSQFFHTLEFRHGPKAIVGPATCLMFFLSETSRQVEEDVLVEMKELGAVTVAVCSRATEKVRHASDLVLEIDFDGPELATLAPSTVPGQLLGFFTGLQKDQNPDHPKNLTRVVILD
jgi:glutamine---fructose-6-phosphate transaminase (isomerizing)